MWEQIQRNLNKNFSKKEPATINDQLVGKLAIPSNEAKKYFLTTAAVCILFPHFVRFTWFSNTDKFLGLCCIFMRPLLHE